MAYTSDAKATSDQRGWENARIAVAELRKVTASVLLILNKLGTTLWSVQI